MRLCRRGGGSADKEDVHPENVHECPESESERWEGVHGRIAPDDQHDDNGCI
jgi:hypothetical protein